MRSGSDIASGDDYEEHAMESLLVGIALALATGLTVLAYNDHVAFQKLAREVTPLP